MAPASTSAGEVGMYGGTVFFHLFPELASPVPVFSTFLEGALHCCEAGVAGGTWRLKSEE